MTVAVRPLAPGDLMDGRSRGAPSRGRGTRPDGSRLAADLTARNSPLPLALTLSPSDGPDDVDNGYASTRAFYAANGFTLGRDFEGYWSGGSTPVLMIRVLD